jgi:hypothetical protein
MTRRPREVAPSVKGLSDAELKVHIDRLREERRGLLRSPSISEQRERIDAAKHKLEVERAHRARKILRAMGDSELTDATRPRQPDEWFCQLAIKEVERRRKHGSKHDEPLRPRFAAMSDAQLGEFAEGANLATEAERRAALAELRKRVEPLQAKLAPLRKAIQLIEGLSPVLGNYTARTVRDAAPRPVVAPPRRLR